MKRKLLAIILAGMFGAGLTISGCGAGFAKGGMENGAVDGAVAPQTSMASRDNAETEMAGVEDAVADEAKMAAGMAVPQEKSDGGALSGDAADTAKRQGEKLIYTYQYSVETKEFDSFYKKIGEKTVQLNGYIENSETSGSISDGINRYANITLRIPAEKMDQMLSLLDSDSNITYQSRSSENVTLRYVDMESHLKVLRTEQETLIQLMEKADKLKDVIELQSQLTEVRYEIESYESQIRMYDNQIDYSTLHLNITEVERTTNVTSSRTSFSEEVKNKFSDNVYAVSQWLRSVAIWLISSLPILVPLAAVVAVAVIFILKQRNKRRNQIPEVQEEEAQKKEAQEEAQKKEAQEEAQKKEAQK